MAHKKTEQVVKEIIESKYPTFEYVGGYTNIDGYVYLKCKECGDVFKHSAQMIRASRSGNTRCKNCIEIEKQKRNTLSVERIQQAISTRIKARVDKEAEREERLTNHICIVCGIVYNANKQSQRYCSNECKHKAINRYKEVRKREFRRNGLVDNTISLERLIVRDKGVCKICGKHINIKDCTYDNEGNFIVGNSYPTIDHIKPNTKGGTHTWDNIQLAHLKCNSIKNAKSIYESQHNQMRFAL